MKGLPCFDFSVLACHIRVFCVVLGKTRNVFSRLKGYASLLPASLIGSTSAWEKLKMMTKFF